MSKPPQAQFAPDVDPASIPVEFLCIVSGILTDTDGTPWINAPWTITAISRSSPPVYIDGGPVVVMFGRLDDTGAFNAYAPRTDFIQPAGVTLRLTVFPIASAPPQVFDNITLTTHTADLGAMISPAPALRIPSAPLVYAYTATEIRAPINGSGYVNTTTNTQYVFVGGLWEPLATAAQDFPPPGIAVSTGSAWDVPSINPESIAYLNTVPQVFTVSVEAPFFFITGQVSGVAPEPGGVFDLVPSVPGEDISSCVRVLAFTDTDLVGQVQLSGLSSTASGSRFFQYLRCSEFVVDQPVTEIFCPLTVDGDFIASGTKAFRIQHPLDESKSLTHACIEGPEVAVYYRGEAETVDGVATVKLPDYFEALTRSKARTVQLTAIVEDDSPVFGGQLAAGRVSGGKFNVYSEDESQRFYWEVKAVRKDVKALEVIGKWEPRAKATL